MNTLKNLVWKVTPQILHIWIRNVFFTLRLFPNVWYDSKRYFIYSGINKSRNYKGADAARITMTYHQLEKGLSYAQPRPGFGKDVVNRLFNMLSQFVEKYGLVAPATTALGVLDAYVAFNESVGVDMSSIKTRILSISAAEHPLEGGSISVSKDQLNIERNSGFKSFFNSRYSVRDFSGENISASDIVEAVSIAQKTPSVCNRQAWKVHAYTKKEDMDLLLSIQKGSRGFGEKASAILIVTCDLSCFVDVAERYQAWIDGGMFSMSLCLAFHSLGFGTCCLNWSKEADDDLAIRKVSHIAQEEQVIMLIAIGTLPETFKVAYSKRRALTDVLSLHQ